jgi:hypothetical protein
VEVALVAKCQLGEVLVAGVPDDVQREGDAVGAHHGTVLGQVRRVRHPAVVEPWRDVDPERHPAPDTANQAEQAMAVGRDPTLGHRHEVDDLPDTVLGHEAGDQDRCVREVQLA